MQFPEDPSTHASSGQLITAVVAVLTASTGLDVGVVGAADTIEVAAVDVLVAAVAVGVVADGVAGVKPVQSTVVAGHSPSLLKGTHRVSSPPELPKMFSGNRHGPDMPGAHATISSSQSIELGGVVATVDDVTSEQS